MLRVGATHLLRVVTHFANRGFLWNEQNLGVHWGFILFIKFLFTRGWSISQMFDGKAVFQENL